MGSDRFCDMGRRGQLLDGVRVIDAHAHLGFCQIGVLASSAERMVGVMDRIGVEKVAISSFAAIGPDAELGNDAVRKVVDRYPDRFIGYAAVNPNYTSEIVFELDRCFSGHQFKAIKIHPSFHDYPVCGEGYVKVYEFANSRGIPILSHTWGSADILEKLATQYSNVNFISAHAGGYDPRKGNDKGFSKLLDLAREKPNVYLDVTFSVIFAGAFKELVERVGADKLLYASDCPFLNMPFQIGRVLMADVCDEVKLEILGQNAARLFKI
jgi:predicted TIM-barrel fold metal-dependent hydrolase